MAARFWVIGLGGANDWSNTNHWSTTSGGTGGSAVPTNADDVTFDVLSPDCTLDTPTAKVAKSVTATVDYGLITPRTLTFNVQLTLSGSITLGANMLFAGSGAIISSTTGTWTANGIVCPQPVQLNGTATFTFSGTWTQTGTTTIGGGSVTTTLSGNLDIKADLSINVTTGNVTGGTVTIKDTCTITMPSRTSGTFRSSLTFNASGKTITWSGSIGYGTGTLTYTAGTIVTTGSTLDVTIAGATLTTSGMSWNNVNITHANGTTTLGSALTTLGSVILGSGTQNVIVNGFSITIGGSLSTNFTSGSVTGTTTLTMNGSGTLTNAQTVTGSGCLQLSLTFNTAGTLTFTGTFSWAAATLTYTAGTVNASGSTLSVPLPASTLTTSGMSWGAVTITHGNGTTTLGSNLTATGLVSLGSTSTNNDTFNGFTINCGAGLRLLPTTGDILGTTAIVLNGSGTWDAPSWQASSFFRMGGVTVTNNAAITVVGSVPFDTATLTVDSGSSFVLGASGAFVVEANTTFACGGAALPGLRSSTAGITITLNSNTGILTGGVVVITGTAASPILLKSNSGGTRRKFTVGAGASMDIGYCNPTDIDSSDGQTVYAFKATQSNTLNWSDLTPLTGLGSGFVGIIGGGM